MSEGLVDIPALPIELSSLKGVLSEYYILKKGFALKPKSVEANYFLEVLLGRVEQLKQTLNQEPGIKDNGKGRIDVLNMAKKIYSNFNSKFERGEYDQKVLSGLLVSLNFFQVLEVFDDPYQPEELDTMANIRNNVLQIQQFLKDPTHKVTSLNTSSNKVEYIVPPGDFSSPVEPPKPDLSSTEILTPQPYVATNTNNQTFDYNNSIGRQSPYASVPSAPHHPTNPVQPNHLNQFEFGNNGYHPQPTEPQPPIFNQQQNQYNLPTNRNTMASMEKVKKDVKFALSSLQFDDLDSAEKFLKEALNQIQILKNS